MVLSGRLLGSDQGWVVIETKEGERYWINRAQIILIERAASTIDPAKK